METPWMYSPAIPITICFGYSSGVSRSVKDDIVSLQFVKTVSRLEIIPLLIACCCCSTLETFDTTTPNLLTLKSTPLSSSVPISNATMLSFGFNLFF